MTKAEAIRILTLERDDWETSHCSPMYRREAFQMAIEALKNSSDLISRQAAIDEAEDWIEAYNSGRGGQRERDAIKHVISGIKKLPSAQPELIEQGAYVRGFEQGRTQGMIDAQGAKDE